VDSSASDEAGAPSAKTSTGERAPKPHIWGPLPTKGNAK